MDALRKLHAALVPGGLLVDTQPVSARPSIEADGAEIGTLDMREWARTIDAVDRRTAEAVGAGLFGLETERRFLVADSFGSGDELVAVVRDWAGTRIDPAVAERVAAEPGSASVHQDVRLRVYRAR